MPLRMTATNVTEIKHGVWDFDMPPHQVRHFGTSNSSVGARSVLLLTDYKYEPETMQLHFEVDDVVPVNIGTTSRAIGLAAFPNGGDEVYSKQSGAPANHAFGPGDREFLRMTKAELAPSMQEVSESLLTEVRRRSPGDLKRGKSRNFSDTPDNFWYVIVQPRISELSITVRGPVDRFRRIAKLEIKDDRGNTRFKVRSLDDVSAAIDLIFHAIRKN